MAAPVTARAAGRSARIPDTARANTAASAAQTRIIRGRVPPYRYCIAARRIESSFIATSRSVPVAPAIHGHYTVPKGAPERGIAELDSGKGGHPGRPADGLARCECAHRDHLHG